MRFDNRIAYMSKIVYDVQRISMLSKIAKSLTRIDNIGIYKCKFMGFDLDSTLKTA